MDDQEAKHGGHGLSARDAALLFGNTAGRKRRHVDIVAPPTPEERAQRAQQHQQHQQAQATAKRAQRQQDVMERYATQPPAWAKRPRTEHGSMEL